MASLIIGLLTALLEQVPALIKELQADSKLSQADQNAKLETLHVKLGIATQAVAAVRFKEG